MGGEGQPGGTAIIVRAGDRFDNGRPQREWLSVASDKYEDWLALAVEAESFVGGH